MDMNKQPETIAEALSLSSEWNAKHLVRIAELEAELAEARDNVLPQLLEWRGVETPCKRCGGSGRVGYANTATWRGGIGGSMMTADVCNGCWGTGDEHRKGVDLRKVLFEDTRTALAARGTR